MVPVLEVKQLVKRYRTLRAVDGISFTVPRGQVIGLLGPNGAGKTTTIHILLGIVQANGGAIHYFGQDFFQQRQACLQRINFASSFNTLQGRITVLENLSVFAGLYSMRNPRQKILELVDYFQMNDCLHKRFWDLSAGQKTRIVLVKALLNDPEILLMDEPTASLDPDIADKLLNLIEQLKHDRALSILYTSHDMAEVTRICDEVIFLDHGKIVAQDTPLGLTKRITHSQLQLAFDGERAAIQRVLDQAGLHYDFPQSFSVTIDMPDNDIPKMIFQLSQSGIWITDIAVKKPTLEDVFLQIARGHYDFTS